MMKFTIHENEDKTNCSSGDDDDTNDRKRKKNLIRLNKHLDVIAVICLTTHKNEKHTHA